MASHGGDETKTTSYMSKFLKYAPERAGGGGRKENYVNLLLIVYILYAVYEERKY